MFCEKILFLRLMWDRKAVRYQRTHKKQTNNNNDTATTTDNNNQLTLVASNSLVRKYAMFEFSYE